MAETAGSPSSDPEPECFKPLEARKPQEEYFPRLALFARAWAPDASKAGARARPLVSPERFYLGAGAFAMRSTFSEGLQGVKGAMCSLDELFAEF